MRQWRTVLQGSSVFRCGHSTARKQVGKLGAAAPTTRPLRRVRGETACLIHLRRLCVNLTSRIERLCRELDRNLIMSEDFVRYLDSPVSEIGYFHLRGFSRMQLLFGLPA